MRTKWKTKQATNHRPSSKRGGATVVMNEGNTKGTMDFRQMVALNAAGLMRTLLSQRGKGKLGGGNLGRRNIEEACGYITDLTFDDYYQTYDRGDVAARIIEAYPDYTWLQNPEIFERPDNKITKFEKDWDVHQRECRPFAELRKLDILAGIGRFGLLVMGVNDGKKLDEELMPTKGNSRTISYYRAYHEGQVEIEEYDVDPNSPRYGLPVMYSIKPDYDGDTAQIKRTPISQDGQSVSKKDDPLAKGYKVHHTRCIHFADNALCGEIFGVERLRRTFNRISDILKVVGGSAEMFWQGAFSGIAFEMDADAEMSEDDKQKMREDIDNYINRMQRMIMLQGVKANPLSPNISSPKDHLDVQLTLISIVTGIPKRILTGSEMGKLASVQDSENWSLQVQRRRANVAQPYLLEKYVLFCIRNGIVRAPATGETGFQIKWSELAILTQSEKAKAAENFTTALDSYCNKCLYFAMDFADYLMQVWGFDTMLANKLAQKFDKAAFEKIRKENMKAKAAAPVSAPGAKSTATTKSSTAKDKSRAKQTSKVS